MKPTILASVFIAWMSALPMPSSAQSEHSPNPAKELTTLYEGLLVKAGTSMYSLKPASHEQLRKKLAKWEFNLVIAVMFQGVADNGGWLHGMACMFDLEIGDPDFVSHEEMIAALEEIGVKKTLAAMKAAMQGLKRLKAKKYGELEEKDYERLSTAIDKVYEATIEAEEFDVLLLNYAQKHRALEKAKLEAPKKEAGQSLPPSAKAGTPK